MIGAPEGHRSHDEGDQGHANQACNEYIRGHVGLLSCLGTGLERLKSRFGSTNYFLGYPPSPLCTAFRFLAQKADRNQNPKQDTFSVV